jgi:hypothetical protein
VKDKHKNERLKRFLGKDMCACGNQLLCEGICRREHRQGNKTVCGELYHITIPKPKVRERRK